ESTYRTVEAFGNLAQDADVALFYFSGHGLQIDGTNYLFPTDLKEFKSTNVDFQTLNANLVLAVMNKFGARLKVMLLDACRTNPFTQVKALTGGLAPMQAPRGTVIGFATQPNTTAWPGPEGGNSPYARALTDAIGVKGLQLLNLLNDVGIAVM